MNIHPWFSHAEWEEVYGLIKSGTIQEGAKAYMHMKLWKSRVSLLPAGVEVTMALLNPNINQESTENDRIDLDNKLFMMSDAIIRTVAIVRDRKWSRSCRLHLPESVGPLRNSIAHSNFLNIASLDVISVYEECLSWIKNAYWAKYEAKVKSKRKLRDDDEDIDEINKLFHIIDAWGSLKEKIHKDEENTYQTTNHCDVLNFVTSEEDSRPILCAGHGSSNEVKQHSTPLGLVSHVNYHPYFYKNLIFDIPPETRALIEFNQVGKEGNRFSSF